MALTPEQKRLVKSKRSERNHRLIVSAATIEAVASERGYERFEIDEKTARKMAEAYFDLLESERHRGGTAREGL